MSKKKQSNWKRFQASQEKKANVESVVDFDMGDIDEKFAGMTTRLITKTVKVIDPGVEVGEYPDTENNIDFHLTRTNTGRIMKTEGGPLSQVLRLLSTDVPYYGKPAPYYFFHAAMKQAMAVDDEKMFDEQIRVFENTNSERGTDFATEKWIYNDIKIDGQKFSKLEIFTFASPYAGNDGMSLQFDIFFGSGSLSYLKFTI